MKNHWYNDGKQILIKEDKMENKEKTHRQWRSNQGRSPVRQNRAEILLLTFVIVGMILIAIASTI